MPTTQTRALTATCVVLLLAVLAGGYLLYAQRQEIAVVDAKISSLESAQTAQQEALAAELKANGEAVKAAQGQIAGLASALTGTQNRLAADEQQLKVTTERLPPDVTALASKVSPSVVLISCGNGVGSGFALRLPPAPGYTTVIATAAHVVASCAPGGGAAATGITITAQSRTIPAVLRSLDTTRDVALLDVTAHLGPLGPATAPPVPGEFVLAVGNPLGLTDLANSVTQGNISKVNGEKFTHTASISNGNSGGPLVDRAGKVIGIVSGAFTASDSVHIIENLNVAVRLTALCDSVLSGPACTGLH